MRLRPKYLRRHVLLIGAVLAALAILSAPAAGDSSQYPTTLYLSGIASTTLPGAYQLVSSPGVGANVPLIAPYALPAPTAAVCTDPVNCPAGMGPLSTAAGSPYSYRYTEVDAGGETPPSQSASAPRVTNGWITVGGLPIGVTVRLYRVTGTTTNPYYEVAQLTNNSSSTYIDGVSPDPSGMNGGTLLPQAQTRTPVANPSVPATGTGWFEYEPGQAISATGISGTCTLASGPGCAVASPVTFDGKGWIVDGAGNVHFPADTWSVKVKITSSATNAGASAWLGIGMWTVNGGTAGTEWVDPNCSTPSCPSGAQPGLNTTVNIAKATTGAIVTSFSLPAITLGAGDHLFFEFYRDQTAASSGTTLSTLNAYDGVASITHLLAPSTLPNIPTLVTPNVGVTANSDTLTSTFSDPDAGDTGTLTFNLCSDSACSSVLATNTSASLANGANASWTPASLADGTYWWRVMATDASGGQSGWTTPQSFTLDTTPPGTTIGTSPASPTSSTTAALTFSANESGSTFQCQLDGGSYTVCTSPQTYSGLGSGSHTFRAKATDVAGNTDATPDTAAWTVDTTTPTTTLGSSPASLTSSTSAAFIFSSSKSGSTFQCQLDGGGYTTCHSPQSYGSLADGSHTFKVKATDTAGNTDLSPATATWTVDTTPPRTTIGNGPTSVTSLNVATFSFDSNESGSTFQCQLDRDGYTPCHSPQSYGHLDDGSHLFNVRATDAVGNTDPTPAAFEWTVDTTTLSPVAPAPNAVVPIVASGDPTGNPGGAAPPVSTATLAVHITSARTLSCVQTTRQLSLHIKLGRKANVAVRFLTAAGVPLGATKSARVNAGSQTLKLHLPFVPAKGKSYRVIVTARSSGKIVKDEIKLTIKKSPARTPASAGTCQ